MQRANLTEREGGTLRKVTMTICKTCIICICICSSCYFCDTILLSFASAVAAANPGLLKALNQMDTDEERLLFVSQLHKVHIRTYVVS